MGLQMIYTLLVAVLCTSLSSAASVSGSLGVSVRSPVSVHRSHTSTLPCWFNLPQSAEGLEVRWYRGDHFDIPILLYRADKIGASKDASYEGRVSFGLKDAASGGLKAGDASLKLMNVTIDDAGDYTCYVSIDQGYDRGAISLSVKETGTSPSLSVMWNGGNQVNVSCESAGWYPQPQLRWLDKKQALTPKDLNYHKDSSGLVSVHSWLLGSGSSEFSCLVGPSDGEEKVARVHLGNSFQTAEQASGSSVAGWVAFTLLLLVMLAFLGWLYTKNKALFFGKKDKAQNDQADGNSLTALLLNKADVLAEATKYYVNVTLEQLEHPYLTIKDRKLRDKSKDFFPDSENLSSQLCLTTVKGTPGFSSGKHYWEVSLWNEVTGLKQSWWLGVTSATSFPLQNNGALTQSNGFWFLSSSPDRANSFQFNTNPKVFLPVLSRPKTVGVYLDYDSGELSFYNVDDKGVIASLTATFTREVFPLFNPGRDDKTPMEIIHITVQDKCNETDRQVVE
ncbi:butyrophilin subfamily 3 member A3-like [Channa argus]|uniref:butyrophilin subfamily 3 member A3-like n=1 Tax=Channa argus TaxID=215402 RepID=UPI00352226CF